MVELGQGVEAFDVFEFVVAQIQTGQFDERFQAGDVFEEVIVEFEIL